MLSLHTSNRLEALARSLAQSIQELLRSALAPELVVVQSQGMARWVKLQLAQHHGICSNCDCPFPRTISYAAFRAVLPELPAGAGGTPLPALGTVLRLPGIGGSMSPALLAVGVGPGVERDLVGRVVLRRAAAQDVGDLLR